MAVSAVQMARIKNGIRMKFRVYGDGFIGSTTPFALAYKDKPMSFHQGVNVEDVIRFIAYELDQQELPLQKPPGKRAIGRR